MTKKKDKNKSDIGWKPGLVVAIETRCLVKH